MIRPFSKTMSSVQSSLSHWLGTRKEANRLASERLIEFEEVKGKKFLPPELLHFERDDYKSVEVYSKDKRLLHVGFSVLDMVLDRAKSIGHLDVDEVKEGKLLPLGKRKRCLIAQSGIKKDGYVQVKLKKNFNGVTRSKAARFVRLQLLERILNLPNKDKCFELLGKYSSKKPYFDASHTCGNGELGCINLDHVFLEERATNLERKKCNLVGVCIKTKEETLINQCKHHKPRCILPTVFEEFDDI